MNFAFDLAGLLQSLTDAGLPGLLALAAFALSAYLLASIFRPSGVPDFLLFYFPLLCALVCVAGYGLSAFNALNRTGAWALAGGLLCVIVALGTWFLARNAVLETRFLPETGFLMPGFRVNLRGLLNPGGLSLTPAEKRLIAPLVFTALVLALVNLDLAIHVAPLNWDSMTYHLARMAYYLQHGNLSYFDANYWAQVTHPKNSSLLMIFTYLVAHRNENLTQLVQFASYLVATLAIYGICRKLGRGRYVGLFAALVFALLIECLMESSTTQNDMQLTVLIGVATYALLAFRAERNRKYLLLTALGVGLALGMKSSTFLVGPSLAVLALYALVPQVWLSRAREMLARRGGDASQIEVPVRRVAADFGVLIAALVVAACALALPAGYVENVRVYGNPIGTAYVRELHAFEGEPIPYVLENGTRNLLRFGMEFLSFDGLPAGGFFTAAQTWIRQWPHHLFDALHIDLQITQATRSPFVYDKAPFSHEDMSYWGVFGFALILPIVGLSLLGVIRVPGNWPLAVATLLFIVAQSYSGPYDPWRGRYFIIMAIFAVPTIACCVRQAFLPWRVYLTLIVLLGCLSAVTAVLGRSNDAPEEVYTMNRLQQLTRNRRNYTEPIRLFERIVPPDATVAVAFGEDTFEYPLFGKHLTRKLIPINSFLNGMQAIPPEADYLIYSENVYPDWKYKDIELGQDWYLRNLRRAKP
jgi:hypothetical protein